MKRKTIFIITALLCSLFPSANAELVISEVMARGGNEFPDEDGAHPDWIELFNNTSESLDLGNYALTDDQQDLLKWRFPKRSLEPRSYAIVFASGKDRHPEKGNLHANFKLDGSGEYLAAVRVRDKKVVSAFDPHFPAAGKGESFGHVTQDDRIDTTSIVFFEEPSPGEPNGKAWLPADRTSSGHALTHDEIFPTDRVIDIQITLAKDDWDTIRKQTRNLFEVLAEERKQAPIEGPYTYVDADITIDNHRFPKVGVRKKGFIGSQSSSRPSLKVKLNHIDRNGGIDGLTTLTLNNNKQDTTLVNQYMGYTLFNNSGSPAPRCAFAKVTVNGVNLGIYSHVETIRKPLIERAFGNSSGTLYEGTVVDFREGWEGSFEKKFGNDKQGRAMIRKLIDLLESDEVDSDPGQLIGELVDLDAFYRFWTLEGLTGFWDGYTGNHNNFFTYFNPDNGKFHFLPWGADSLYTKYSKLGYDPKAPISVKTKGMIAHKLYQSRAGRERYARAMQQLLKEQWNEDELITETKRIEKLILPHVAPSQSGFTDQLEELREFISTRRDDLVAEISDGMPVWRKVPEPPPTFPSLAGGLSDDSIWNAAKNGDIPLIKEELAKGADVDAPDAFGSVPLSLAALTGKFKAMEFLIGKGADVNAVNKKNETAMHSAAFLGHLEALQVLIKHEANINFRNDDGATPFDVASAPWSDDLQGIIQFVGGLLQIQIDLEEIRANRPKAAALLRKAGGRPGSALPRQAAGSLWEAAKTGDLKALKTQLAEDGVDINKRDSNGITPLSWTALTGHLKAAELLLSEGADINATNRDGSNSLHSAAFFGRLDIVKLLVKNRINLGNRNDEGETALDIISTPWNEDLQGILQFIAGILKIEVNPEDVKSSRPKIAAFLRKHADEANVELE
ncbi:MAG: CotH kinase family protein [Roseibacillus sp.]|nr:CotH kinase family protein [Roseibacillus sp.]